MRIKEQETRLTLHEHDDYDDDDDNDDDVLLKTQRRMHHLKKILSSNAKDYMKSSKKTSGNFCLQCNYLH